MFAYAYRDPMGCIHRLAEGICMTEKRKRDYSSQLVDFLTQPPEILPIPPLLTSIPIPAALRAEDLEDMKHRYLSEAGNPLRAVSQAFDQIYVHFFQTALQEHPNAASARKTAQREFISYVQRLANKQGFNVSQISIKDDSPYGGEHDEMRITATIPVDGKPTTVGVYSRPLQDFTPLEFLAFRRR